MSRTQPDHDHDQANAEPDSEASFLENLVGYNSRRAWLAIHDNFVRQMTPHALTQAEFSVLATIKAKPQVNLRMLAASLAIAPPNLATRLDGLERRELLQRQRNQADKRIQTVKLTTAGSRLLRSAMQTVQKLETESTSRLTDGERTQLNTLLKKIYIDA